MSSASLPVGHALVEVPGYPHEERTAVAGGWQATSEAGQLTLRALVAEGSVVNQKVALRMLADWGCRADAVGSGLADMSVAIEAGDCATPGAAAHGLKGSSRTIGAEALSASCSELELMARCDALTSTAGAVARARAELARAARALDEAPRRAA